VRVHWFDDRIEIISPGGPYGNVTEKNFGTAGVTDYRNPSIADALKILGFVQVFGRGIITAQNELQKNGNPPLEFACDQNFVKAVLRK
jgi:ATP-dependent DNA helicase RecG